MLLRTLAELCLRMRQGHTAPMVRMPGIDAAEPKDARVELRLLDHHVLGRTSGELLRFISLYAILFEASLVPS